MRALFFKELGRGRNLLVFALAGGALHAAISFLLSRVAGGAHVNREMLTQVSGALGYLLMPGLIVLFAGAGMFAAETERGTLPLLLTLPLSRGQIWLATVLARFMLAALAIILFVFLSLGGLSLWQDLRGTELAGELVDWPLWLSLLFATGVFCSTLLGRAISAILATLLIFGGLVTAAGFLVCNFGGSLLGYDPALDSELWTMVAIPGLLLSSLGAFIRGELLQTGRKWRIALALLVPLTLLIGALVLAVARIDLRYERAEVEELSVIRLALDGSALSMNAARSPVLLERTYQGWKRPRREPDYRAKHIVVADLRSGKDVLARPGAGFAAVSAGARLAAVFSDPPPVTWRSWRYYPGINQIEVWDLQRHRRLYRGLPREFRKTALDWESEAEWSPDASWLAIQEASTRPRLLLMRANGKQARVIPLSRFPGEFAPNQLGRSWAWASSGRAIYCLKKGWLLLHHDLGTGGSREIWRTKVRLPGRHTGGISVSPNGRWIALALLARSDELLKELRSPSPDASVPLLAAMVVAEDGSETHPVIIASPRLGFRQQVQLLWSFDSQRLYVFLSGGRPALLRWQEGEGFASPLGLPQGLWVKQVALLPGDDELLLWGYNGIYLASKSGEVRPLPDSYLWPLSGGHDLIGVDARGRAIITPWPLEQGWPRELKAIDFKAARVRPLYPSPVSSVGATAQPQVEIGG
jgi:Cu-processing system permease protein